jgi:N-acetylmuramoyl-L-alanine amidase
MKFRKIFGYTTSVMAISMFTSFSVMAAPVEVVDTNETTVVAEASSEPEETRVLDDTSAPEETGDMTTQKINWDTYLAADVKNSLNVRSEPSTDSEKVGLLFRGGTAEVLEVGDEWTKIHSGDVEGYVNNKYVVFGEEARLLANEVTPMIAVVHASTLNVRSEAHEEAAVAKVVKDGVQLPVVEDELEEAEWIPVDLGEEKVGYVSSEYVEVEQNFENAKTIEQAEAYVQSVPAMGGAIGVSQSELDLLAAIIQCEAGGEGYDGMIAVGAVVMNRVNSGSFPGTITEVVYQSGQFTPAATGFLSNVLSSGARSDCYEAAQDVLNGANNVGDSLFFHAGSGNGLVIGNQTFY